MSSQSKRPRSSSSPSVSPPALKRRAYTQSADHVFVEPSAGSPPLRIFSWNVNGIGPLLQKRLIFSPREIYPLRKFLKRHRWPQLLCMQEVKINLKDEVTQRRLKHAANTGNEPDEPTYVVHFSLPRDKWNATGFNGRVHGVATLIRDDFSHHVTHTRKPDWDLEGRVLIHEVDGGLSVLNGYWVNGTTQPYRNPDTGTVQGTRHDHKLHFHQNMLREALRLQQANRHVILVGDMNVARDRIDGHPNLRTFPEQHVKNRIDFNEKFFTAIDGLKAIDVFRKIHGNVRKYTYHPRGCGWGQSCDRVDLIISTTILFHSGAIVASDICDNPEDRGHSDHVPLWVSIDTEKLPKISLIKPDEYKQIDEDASKLTSAVVL